MSHSQFHCTGRAYLDMHGLIFETSICYWQDQPGRGARASERAEQPSGKTGRREREREAAPRERKGREHTRARHRPERTFSHTHLSPPLARGIGRAAGKRRPRRARSGRGRSSVGMAEREATGDAPPRERRFPALTTRGGEPRDGRAGDGGGRTGKATRRNPTTPASTRRETGTLPTRDTPGSYSSRHGDAPKGRGGAHGRTGAAAGLPEHTAARRNAGDAGHP